MPPPHAAPSSQAGQRAHFFRPTHPHRLTSSAIVRALIAGMHVRTVPLAATGEFTVFIAAPRLGQAFTGLAPLPVRSHAGLTTCCHSTGDSSSTRPKAAVRARTFRRTASRSDLRNSRRSSAQTEIISAHRFSFAIDCDAFGQSCFPPRSQR